MDILFMGDGEWAKKALEEIIALNFTKVKGVVIRKSPNDFKLRNYALDNDIEIYQPDDINSRRFCKKTKQLNLDLIVSVSYDQILEKEFLAIPPKGVINFHAGKLPFYRGRSPINWAIINGEKEIGLTIHYIDEGIDTGDIILQKLLPIDEQDNYRTVLNKAEKEAPYLIEQAIRLIEKNNVRPIQQKDRMGIYLPKREKGDEVINWNWKTKRTHDFIRALVPPGPGARTFYNNEEIKILSSKKIATEDFIGNNGQIIGKTQKGLKVKTGDKAILIEDINSDSGLNVSDINIGDQFGLDYRKEFYKLKRRLNELEKK